MSIANGGYVGQWGGEKDSPNHWLLVEAESDRDADLRKGVDKVGLGRCGQVPPGSSPKRRLNVPSIGSQIQVGAAYKSISIDTDSRRHGKSTDGKLNNVSASVALLADERVGWPGKSNGVPDIPLNGFVRFRHHCRRPLLLVSTVGRR